jgi:hypothetical protein
MFTALRVSANSMAHPGRIKHCNVCPVGVSKHFYLGLNNVSCFLHHHLTYTLDVQSGSGHTPRAPCLKQSPCALAGVGQSDAWQGLNLLRPPCLKEFVATSLVCQHLRRTLPLEKLPTHRHLPNTHLPRYAASSVLLPREQTNYRVSTPPLPPIWGFRYMVRIFGFYLPTPKSY